MTALTYAAFLLVFRQSNRRHLAPAPGPLLDATLGAVVGSLLLGLFDPGFTLAFSWPQHGWLIGLGLLIQSFGWLLITIALPRLAALETSVLLLLQPMLTIVWARLIFAEALSTIQWLGVAVVLGGILVLAMPGNDPSRRGHTGVGSRLSRVLKNTERGMASAAPRALARTIARSSTWGPNPIDPDTLGGEESG